MGVVQWAALGQVQTQPAKSPEWFKPMIRAVEVAATAAEAQAAYARASAIDSDNAELMSAYVRRLVEFDLPEAVYETAQKLVALDPTHGPAWAVIAHMRMRLGQPAEAISAVLKAAELRPEDPFVLRTAADLIARHEYEGQDWQIGDALKTAIEKARNELGKNETFAAAYRQKRSEYELAARLEQARLEQAGVAGREGQTEPPAAELKDGYLQQYEEEFPYLAGERGSVDLDIDVEYRYYDDYRYRYFPYFGPYYYPYDRHRGVILVCRGFHRNRPFRHSDLFHNPLTDNPLIRSGQTFLIDDTTLRRFTAARAAGLSPRRAAPAAARGSAAAAASRTLPPLATRANALGADRVVALASDRTVGGTAVRSTAPLIRRSLFSGGSGSRSSSVERSGRVGRLTGARSISSLRSLSSFPTVSGLRSSSGRLATARSVGRGGVGPGRAPTGLTGRMGGRAVGRR
ncbi:MAG: hypothetical protein AMJ81_00700 [Phycisphaerae bacterium SM23_33]|nr:MAG: hypothetical protein AMJ81_00700 [Phycisphaerae bacterium SM23_33]